MQEDGKVEEIYKKFEEKLESYGKKVKELKEIE
jgi:hypothetical protein